VLQISAWNYRVRLPGFDLPDPVHAAQREFDEECAGILEVMADRLDGKVAEVRDNFNNSWQQLEQCVEIYGATEPQTTLATGLRTYLGRGGRIRAVTCALLREIVPVACLAQPVLKGNRHTPEESHRRQCSLSYADPDVAWTVLYINVKHALYVNL